MIRWTSAVLIRILWAALIVAAVARVEQTAVAQLPVPSDDPVATQPAGDDDDDDDVRLGDDDDDMPGDDDDDEPDIAVFPWGHPDYTAGDELIYPFWPDWILRAYKVGGFWMTWEVSASEPEGVGALYMVLDPVAIDGGVTMTIEFVDFSGSSLYVDLLDANGDVVVADLYGNIIGGTDQVVTPSFIVPFDAYPEATTIRVRRGVGEISVFTIWLDGEEFLRRLEISGIRQRPGGPELTIDYPPGFIDRLEVYTTTDLRNDQWRVAVTNLPTDGLPRLVWDDTEAAAPAARFYRIGNGTVDVDLDSLPDAREKVVHKTDPNNSDTDGDELPDGWEVRFDIDALDGTGANGAAGDPDADGVDNETEFKRGRRPNVGAVDDVNDTLRLRVLTPLRR